MWRIMFLNSIKSLASHKKRKTFSNRISIWNFSGPSVRWTPERTHPNSRIHVLDMQSAKEPIRNMCECKFLFGYRRAKRRKFSYSMETLGNCNSGPAHELTTDAWRVLASDGKFALLHHCSNVSVPLSTKHISIIAKREL